MATGELTVEEACKFLKDLNELESRNLTEIRITYGLYMDHESDKSIVSIVIYNENEVVRDFIKQTFKDGLLNTWGWDKKFSVNTTA